VFPATVRKRGVSPVLRCRTSAVYEGPYRPSLLITWCGEPMSSLSCLLLAAGTDIGYIGIWDFETRGLAKTLPVDRYDLRVCGTASSVYVCVHVVCAAGGLLQHGTLFCSWGALRN
jgi:hypothetical protein